MAVMDRFVRVAMTLTALACGLAGVALSLPDLFGLTLLGAARCAVARCHPLADRVLGAAAGQGDSGLHLGSIGELGRRVGLDGYCIGGFPDHHFCHLRQPGLTAQKSRVFVRYET